MKFYHDIELEQNELKLAKMHRGTANSAGVGAGDLAFSSTEKGGNIMYDTADFKLKYWRQNAGNTSGSWVELSTGTSGSVYDLQIPGNVSVSTSTLNPINLYNSTNSTIDGTVNIRGTAGEIDVLSNSVGQYIQVGLPTNVDVDGHLTIGGNTTVAGDLQVNGTTTYLNTTNLEVGDNIIELNSDYDNTGTPPNITAGIEVNNWTTGGSSADNPQFVWNEATQSWTFTNDGTTYYNLIGSQTQTGQALGYGKILAGGVTAIATVDHELISFADDDFVNAVATNSGAANGDKITFSHADPAGVNTGSYSATRDPSTNATFTWGGTYSLVEGVTFDAKGHRLKQIRKSYQFPSQPSVADTFNRYRYAKAYQVGSDLVVGNAVLDGSATVTNTVAQLQFYGADPGLDISLTHASNVTKVYFKGASRVFKQIIKHSDVTSQFTHFADGSTIYIGVNHGLGAGGGLLGQQLTVECWSVESTGTGDYIPHEKVSVDTIAATTVNNTLTSGSTSSALASGNSNDHLAIRLRKTTGKGFWHQNHILIVTSANLDENIANSQSPIWS